MLIVIHKPMVRNHGNHGVPRRNRFRRGSNIADDGVKPLQHGQVLRGKHTGFMLDVVQRRQMQQQQTRMFLLQNPDRVFAAHLIGFGAGVDPAAIVANFRGCFVHQSFR